MLEDDDLMSWNPHRGKKLRDVPKSYWAWCLRQEWFKDHEDLYEYAKLAVCRSESYEEAVRSLREPHRRSEPFRTRLDLKNPKDDGISDPFANA